jgi:hypothetical protein
VLLELDGDAAADRVGVGGVDTAGGVAGREVVAADQAVAAAAAAGLGLLTLSASAAWVLVVARG